MKWIIALLGLILAGSAPAQQLLPPGIYRLQPPVAASAASAASAPAANERIRDRFEHALPAAAKVQYAFVSRDARAGLNKLVFVTDAGYRHDINSADKLCPAYAFPGWNQRSAAQPFCRTNISPDRSEAALEWDSAGFTLRWPADKRHLGSESIAPQRRPSAEEAGACAISDVCEPAAYGTTINRYEVIHYSDRFALQAARDYVDVLNVRRPVPVHALDAAGPITGELAAGSYVAVTAQDAQGFRIEQVSIAGSTTPGWIVWDDVVQPQWIEASAATADFRFRLAFEPSEDDDTATLVAIEVRDASTGKRLQLIRDFSTEPVAGASDLLQLVDANFDGWLDLQVPAWSGGAGPNDTRNFFLFDPASRRFVFDEALSALTQVSIDGASSTVTSASRGGCCSHSVETYRYIGNELELVGSEEESLSADGRYWLTTRGERLKGAMRYRTSKRRADVEGR